MGKTTITVPLLLVAVLGSGCTESREESVSNPTRKTAQPVDPHSRPAAANAVYDLQFLDTMIVHHQGAVEMARLAESKLQNAELKLLAARIPDAQAAEVLQMQRWRKEWYAEAPSAENLMMPGMAGSMMDMDHMKTMRPGKVFDAMFIDMMIPHHQGAVQMGENALAKAGREEIKELAKTIIDDQTREIEQMKKIRATLPNPPRDSIER